MSCLGLHVLEESAKSFRFSSPHSRQYPHYVVGGVDGDGDVKEAGRESRRLSVFPGDRVPGAGYEQGNESVIVVMELPVRRECHRNGRCRLWDESAPCLPKRQFTGDEDREAQQSGMGLKWKLR